MAATLEDLRRRLESQEAQILARIATREASNAERQDYLRLFGSLQELSRVEQRRRTLAGPARQAS